MPVWCVGGLGRRGGREASSPGRIWERDWRRVGRRRTIGTASGERDPQCVAASAEGGASGHGLASLSGSDVTATTVAAGMSCVRQRSLYLRPWRGQGRASCAILRDLALSGTDVGGGVWRYAPGAEGVAGHVRQVDVKEDEIVCRLQRGSGLVRPQVGTPPGDAVPRGKPGPARDPRPGPVGRQAQRARRGGGRTAPDRMRMPASPSMTESIHNPWHGSGNAGSVWRRVGWGWG